MATLDPNIFYEAQLANPKITWELLAQEWSNEEKNIVKDADYTEVVLRGIISETEFAISGGHDFSPVGGALADLANTLTNYYNMGSELSALGSGGVNDIKKVISGLSPEAADKVQKYEEKIKDKVNGVFSKERMDSLKGLVGSRFVTAFDKTKVFKGTNLEVNFPTLETRIYKGTYFKNPNTTLSKIDMAEPMSMPDVQKSLIHRFIGPLMTIGLDGLDSVVGAQAPPNGYIPSFTTLDPTKRVRGSFKLRYGPYEIPNLLVTSFAFRASTFRCRQHKFHVNYQLSDWVSDRIEVSSDNEPLYLDVQINIQPCNYISRDLLLDILRLK